MLRLGTSLGVYARTFLNKGFVIFKTQASNAIPIILLKADKNPATIFPLGFNTKMTISLIDAV